MKAKKSIVLYIFVWLFIWGAASQVEASYQLKVIVNHSFMVEHFDSLGNVFSDSLCRNREIKAIIYKTEMTDSLSFELVTNDSGFAVFEFDYWHDTSSVDSIDIVKNQGTGINF